MRSFLIIFSLFFTALLSAAPLFPGEKWSTYTPSATLTEQDGTLKVVLKKTPSKITYASIFAKLSAPADYSDYRNVEVRLKSSQKFDIITCNPPYITEQEYKNLPVSVKNFDPKISLIGGKEGLDYYKILARESKKYLKSDGKIFVEIGFKQKDKVEKLFRENGFNVECFKDFSRKNRVIVGSFSERLSND